MTALSTPLGDVNLQGDVGDLPAAGVEGRLYFATDTEELYRDNGTSWDLVAAGGGGPPGTLALDEISDVNATTPADGDALVWDDGASEWVPGAVAGGGALDDLSDVNAPSPTDGQALVWDATPGEWIPGTIAASGGSATALIGCSVSGTSTALTNGAYTSLAFGVADTFDTDGFHDTVTNNTRLTIPAGLGGKYLLTGWTTFPNSGTASTDKRLGYRVSGGTEVLTAREFTATGVGSSDFMSLGGAILNLVAGDYVELRQWVNNATQTTASYFAQLVKLESGRVGNGIGARAYRTTNQTGITSQTAIVFDAEEWDTDGFRSGSSSRLTIPAGLGGFYVVACDIYAANLTAGSYLHIRFKKNGTEFHGERLPVTAAGIALQSVSGFVNVAAADYIEVFVESDDANFDVNNSGTQYPSISIMRLDSGSSGSGGTLAVEESDGSPAHSAVTKLIFPPDTVSLNGAFATIRQVPQAFIGAKATRTTNQSNPPAATAITFDSEDWDTDGFHSTSVNTSRLTIPAGMGGKYLVIGEAAFSTSTGPYHWLTIRKNGSGIAAVQADKDTTTNDLPLEISAVLDLVAGDYVELVTLHGEGGNCTIYANGTYPLHLSIVKLDSGKVGAGIGCRLTMGAAQSIASGGSGTAVLWDTEDFDTDGFHSTSTNTSRVTIPAGLGGKYLLNAGGLTTAVATNGPEIWLKKNGTTDIVGTSRTAAYHSMGGLMGTSTVVELAAGDYVEALFYQSTGSNKNFGYVAASAAAASFQVMRLDSGSSSGGSSVIALNDLTDVATTAPADGDVLAYDSGSSGWVNTAASGGGSGTAFPGSPVADQRFTRTDLDMDFFWNGTRWLSTAVYQHNFGTGYSNITATDANGVVARTQAPMLRGGSDIWLEDYKAVFYISAGSSLSASHKWVVTLRTLSTAASYAIATVTISSGARNAWRTTSGVIDALMDNGVAKLLTLTQATKTGTPGGLYFYSAITYRIVG